MRLEDIFSKQESIMNIILNGNPVVVSDGLTVEQLIKSRNIERNAVVVENNHVIVPREEYGTHKLGHDDAVEILRFVGGG